MTSDTTATLERTATLYGVEAAWVDFEGRRRTAPADVVLDVLGRLGAPVAGPEDVDGAARARRLEIWTRVVPPVRVARPGRAPTVPLRLPAEEVHGTLWWSVVVEAAGARTGVASLADLELAGGSSVEGRRYEVRRFALPADLGLGRHRLVLRLRGREWGCHVIVAPERCHRDPSLVRSWGVFHPLYGLRDEGRGAGAGVGDLGTLRDALEWTASRGGAVFGTTPLLAGFGDVPVDPSPYAPASRLFWDDRVIDLDAAPGAPDVRAAGGFDALAALDRRRDEALVPWDELVNARDAALRALAGRFFAANGTGDPDFQRFLVERPDVGDFARFRAAGARHGRDWRAWPAEARSGRPSEGELDPSIVRRHLYAQWVAARQIERTGDGAGLYLDLPLGSHPDGYDAWRYRELFVDGVSSGAPPDDFFRGGQDWGLPPAHPGRLREDGYRYVTAILGHAMRPAAMVRIDHVMQLHRLYWIPRGAGPDEGVYVRYPAEELAAVIALASIRHRCEVAGEDLGTVPDGMRELMDRAGIRRSSVLGFALDRLADDPDADPTPVAAGSVAAVATHDMVPLRGLREGGDLAERRALGLLTDAEAAPLVQRRQRAFEVLDARWAEPAGDRGAGPAPDPLLGPILAALGSGPAGIVMASMDDLAGVTEPQNVPGTTHERPNWRRRLPVPLSGLGPDVDRILGGLDSARRGSVPS